MKFTLRINIVIGVLFAATWNHCFAVNKKTSARLNLGKQSERQLGSYYQGIMIICEGPTPEARLFVSPSSCVLYSTTSTPNCSSNYVYGRNGTFGSTYLDHSDIWGGKFTGMDYFYERHYNCGSGQVHIRRKVSSGPYRTVFSCAKYYEAHVIYFKIWLAFELRSGTETSRTGR